MTVAVDKVSGRVVGQVVFQIAPLADWYAGSMREPAPIRILTDNGYCYVPRESVRLEVTE